MSLQSPGIELPFTNGFYRSNRSLQFSAQRAVNWYPQLAKKPSLSNSNLYMTAGLRSVVDSTAGVNRGAIRNKSDGKPYFVNGDKLYRVDQNIAPDLTETYTAVEVGTIGGTGRVIMETGQFDLVIVVPDQFTYSWNEGTSTFTPLDGIANFRTARDVVHINSLFIFLESESNIIFHSEFNDPTTYNALAFQQVFQITEGQGLIRYRNQLYVMSDNETIPFNYVDAGQFFFRAQPNAELDIGLRSVFAKTRVRQSFVFLGGGENEEPGVWLFNGGFIKLSTETIDNVIQNLSDFEIQTSFMLKHLQNDSAAVALIIGDECFVYDLNSDCWHERRSRFEEADYRWRVNSIVQAYNRILVGDYFNGQIGIVDDQVNTEYDEKMFRTVIIQPIDNKGKAIRVSSLIVYCDTGFDGHIELDWSNDGGYNWSKVPLRREAGTVGEYGKRIEFDRLGDSPNFRVFRLKTDTDKKININKVIAR